ncbi:MAG: Acetyltransferase YpeA [Syntrophomonadaceae bacterium]|nr:Acetyltransferase YpeA [Bacillota bacterium]
MSELSDSISIQPLQQTDLPSLVSLYNVSYADSPEFVPLDVRTLGYLTFRHPRFDPAFTLVAWCNSNPVGFVLLHRYEEHGAAAVIKVICVKPEFRRRGIGKELLKEASEFAAKSGLMILIAPQVDERNQLALQFFESLGFRPISHICSLRRNLQNYFPRKGKMPKGTRVAKCTEVSVAELTEAYNVIFKDHQGGLSSGDLEHLIGNPNFIKEASFVAKDSGKIVSLLMNEKRGTSAHIFYLGTIPSYEGRGLATLLLDIALRSCKELGFPSVSTEVVFFNFVARHIFEKAKFVEDHGSITLRKKLLA